jgi:proline iminopeptidase
MLNNYNVTRNIHKIANIPVLVAQGSYDILTPSMIKKLLTDHMPHMKLVEIEKCGHWTVVEQPEKMCDVALGFFE